jgi:predicted O-methyltransferase YrrM
MEDKFPNWFAQTAQPNFERFLIPLAGQDNLHFLQIGAYTGDASLWMLENVLTGQFSKLIDIDTWLGSDEEAHDSINFVDVYKIYKERMKPYPQVTSIINKSFNAIQFLNESFDFVYVDGDHTAAGALLDAELSWFRLKPNGILAFDDYTWGDHLPAYLAPKLGINLFLHRHTDEFELLVMNTQVWIRKL